MALVEADAWVTFNGLFPLPKVLDWLRALEKCSSTTSLMSPWKYVKRTQREPRYSVSAG